MSIMDFKNTGNKKGAIFSAKFLDNVNGLIYSKNVIYHSHITGDLIGNAHSYCNLKVRENKSQTCASAQNLFGFHFFFRILENQKYLDRSFKSYKYKFRKYS